MGGGGNHSGCIGNESPGIVQWGVGGRLYRDVTETSHHREARSISISTVVGPLTRCLTGRMDATGGFVQKLIRVSWFGKLHLRDSEMRMINRDKCCELRYLLKYPYPNLSHDIASQRDT